MIFGILYWYFNRAPRRGNVIGLYLVLYSTARFIIEFYRVHEQSLLGPLSLTQWIALALLALGVVFLFGPRVQTTVNASEPEHSHA
jgi:phosphatidylglycerol:prolipoprotein diacylglycerol transferase